MHAYVNVIYILKTHNAAKMSICPATKL